MRRQTYLEAVAAEPHVASSARRLRPVESEQRTRAPARLGGNAVDICRVHKRFGPAGHGVTAIEEASLAIRQNEFFTLLGPSGCGKTTLLRMIAGFEYPTSGEILLYGKDIAAQPPFERPVNTVFQNYALFPHMTVADNIGFGLKMLGWNAAETKARVEAMLALVRMEAFAARRPAQLSGGQQQRVALARALAPQPKVLLLDEPLSALDYKLRKEMQGELKRLQAETGITFIFVTHDQEEALAMSDRIAVMSTGRVVQVGTPREIYDQPADRFVAGFIGETNFLNARIERIVDGEAVVALGSGRKIVATAGRCEPVAGNCVSVGVRPEHARMVAPDQGALAGTVETVVFLGTDTHVHIRLEDDVLFTLRQQSGFGETQGARQGDRVGIAIAAAQVLGD